MQVLHGAPTMTRPCACCGKPFEPCPQVPHQTFCSSSDCQRTRKRLWQQSKLRTDPSYRGNQQDAQRAWRERNPDYWRRYRELRPEHAEHGPDRQSKPRVRHLDQLAKMDVSCFLSGVYSIRFIGPAASAIPGAWIAEITPVPPD